MPRQTKTPLQASIEFAARVISGGTPTNRNFDNCFEWHGRHAVAIALYRRAQKRPYTKLAHKLYKYLSKDAVIGSVEEYGHWDDLEGLTAFLKTKEGE